MRHQRTSAQDPLANVRDHAPENLSADHLDALLHRTLAEIDAPASVSVPTSQAVAALRHRLAVIVTAFVVAAGGGIGVAAAAGGHDRLSDLLSGLFDNPDSRVTETATPAGSHLVFSIPGPPGLDFQGWTVVGTEGGLCTTDVLAPSGQADPLTADIDPDIWTSASCSLGSGSSGLFANMAGAVSAAGPVPLTFVASAGTDTVRAELQVSGGTTYPVTIQNGWLGGWYTRTQVPLGHSATIVAFGSDGRVLGRSRFSLGGPLRPGRP